MKNITGPKLAIDSLAFIEDKNNDLHSLNLFICKFALCYYIILYCLLVTDDQFHICIVYNLVQNFLDL